MTCIKMAAAPRTEEDLFTGHTFSLPLTRGYQDRLVVTTPVQPDQNLVGISGSKKSLSEEYYWTWWTDLMTTSRITGKRAMAVFSLAELEKSERAVFIGYGTGGDILWMLNREHNIPEVTTGLEPNRMAFEMSVRVFETLTAIVNGKTSDTETLECANSFTKPSSLLPNSQYTAGLTSIIRKAQMATPAIQRNFAIKTSVMYGRVPLETFLAATAEKLESMTIEPVYQGNPDKLQTAETQSLVGMAIAYSTKLESGITKYLYLFQTQYPNPALLDKFVETTTGPFVSIALGLADNWPDLYIDSLLLAIRRESKLVNSKYGYTHAATFHTKERLTTPRMRLMALMQHLGTGLSNKLLGTGVNIQNVDEVWMQEIQDLGAEIHHRKGPSHMLIYRVQ